MTRRRITRIVCLAAVASLAVVVGIGAWSVARTRSHARELSEEQRRALRATGKMGDAGATYLKVYAPWGAFNQISYNFRDRALTDEKLRNLAGLTGVVGLDLSENPITDDGLRFVAQVPHLQWLQLSGTKISDRGISYLRRLKNLHSLDVSFTGTTQGAAKDLAKMPGLEVVYARGSGLHDVKGVTVNSSDKPATWIRDAVERPLKQED
jgi:hypothetical protein